MRSMMVPHLGRWIAAPWTLFASSNSRNCIFIVRNQSPSPLAVATDLLRYRGGSLPSSTSPACGTHFRAMSSVAKYHCVHVFVKVKPGTEQAFQEASLQNARRSAKEEGVARFDVLQDQDDPLQFVLVEVYKDSHTAPAAHKETAHYLEWRDTVADMMAEPRAARKFVNVFPTTRTGWEYPDPESLE